MRICQIASGSSITDLSEMISAHGDYDLSYDCDKDTDLIIGWSVTMMDLIEKAHNMFPHIPMVNYNWDIYGWVWETPREGEYDYKRYGELLKQSTEVWCPSKVTVDRQKQWFGVDGEVIITACPYFDAPTKDGDFILNGLRRLPDKNDGIFEQACEELGLPYKSPNHELSLEEFRKLEAECTFNVVPYHENSTGGLSLIETYYLGKPQLISNSPWQGGNEYIQDRATQFQWDDINDLKKKLKYMWENRKPVAKDHKEWVEKLYSKETQGKRIHERLQAIKEKRGL